MLQSIDKILTINLRLHYMIDRESKKPDVEILFFPSDLKKNETPALDQETFIDQNYQHISDSEIDNLTRQELVEELKYYKHQAKLAIADKNKLNEVLAQQPVCSFTVDRYNRANSMYRNFKVQPFHY